MTIRLTVPLIRVLIGLSLLLLLLNIVGAGEILDRLKEIKPAWVLMAAGCILLSTVLGGLNLFLLVDTGKLALRPSRFFFGYWLAWAIGLVVPGGVGDIVAVSAWLKRHDVEWHTGMGKALLDKLISLIWLTGLALWGVADIAFSFDEPGYPIGALVIIASLFVLASMSKPGKKAIRFIRRTLSTAADTVRSRPMRVAINALLTPVKVVVLCLSYWCMFGALGVIELDPWRVITLAAAAGLVAYIPISFNGLGTVEAAGLLLFSELSLPPEIILSAYLLLRLMVVILAWGGVGVWWATGLRER